MHEEEDAQTHFTLHRPRTLHLDVVPFAIAYAVGFGLYLFSPSHEFKREGARIPW
jgi:hypothetical protein